MGLGSFCSKKDNRLITLQPKSLRITGIQKGFVQCLEIYQSIQSEEDLDQVSYVFPTDNNLCIYSMKFQVGDETIEAELRSNEAAKETFQEAKKVGRTVAMTEQVVPGITSVKIGNVPKDKVVAIIFKCAFTSTLQNPTTILTKIPLQATEPDGSVTDLYNLPSLEINVDLAISQLEPIADVYTNCESNYTKTDDCSGKLTINSAILTDENILIMTEFSKPIHSQMVQTDNATSISIIPEFEPIKSGVKEYVFFIDCSASMLGESIRKAKESLHLFLSKLPDNSYFNIIRFGTTFEKLFTQSSQKDDRTINEAKEFIDKIRANLGGTEMLSMFEDLFKDEIKIGGQRQIFIITDGEVYERQKVVQKITENRGFNRIFAIGLGHGADAGFLDEIAEITNGKSDFVFNKDELPSKVSEQLDLSLSDAATETEIHIEGNESFETMPYPLPPLLPHVDTHIFVSSNQAIEDVMVTFKLNKTSEIENLISLRSKLAIDGKSPIYALFAWNQLKKIKDDKEKSIKLSLASGVLCSYTSYIAVSENAYVDSIQQEKASVSVDEDMCHDEMYYEECCDACCVECCAECCDECCSGGWDVCRDECFECAEECSASPREWSRICYDSEPDLPRPSPRLLRMTHDEPICPTDHDISFAKKKKSKAKFVDDADDFYDADGIIETSKLDDVTADTNLINEIDSSKVWSNDASAVDIIRLQSRDGFWDLPSAFITEKYGGKSPELAGIDLSESPIVRKRVISTIFTLAYLEKFEKEKLNRWKFAKEKGLKWLKRIESSANWDQIIKGILSEITK